MLPAVEEAGIPPDDVVHVVAAHARERGIDGHHPEIVVGHDHCFRHVAHDFRCDPAFALLALDVGDVARRARDPGDPPIGIAAHAAPARADPEPCAVAVVHPVLGQEHGRVALHVVAQPFDHQGQVVGMDRGVLVDVVVQFEVAGRPGHDPGALQFAAPEVVLPVEFVRCPQRQAQRVLSFAQRARMGLVLAVPATATGDQQERDRQHQQGDQQRHVVRERHGVARGERHRRCRDAPPRVACLQAVAGPVHLGSVGTHRRSRQSWSRGAVGTLVFLHWKRIA